MKSKMLGALALFTLIGALFVMQSAAQHAPTVGAATGSIDALNVGTCLTTDATVFKGDCKTLANDATGTDNDWEVRDKIGEVTTLYATYAHDPKTASYDPRAILTDSDLIQISIKDTGRDKRSPILVGTGASGITINTTGDAGDTDEPAEDVAGALLTIQDLLAGNSKISVVDNDNKTEVTLKPGMGLSATPAPGDYVIENSGNATLNFTGTAAASDPMDVKGNILFFGCTVDNGTTDCSIDGNDEGVDPTELQDITSSIEVDEDASSGANSASNIAPWLAVNASVPTDKDILIYAIYYETSKVENLVGGEAYSYGCDEDYSLKRTTNADMTRTTNPIKTPWKCEKVSNGTVMDGPADIRSADTDPKVDYTSDEIEDNDALMVQVKSDGDDTSQNLWLEETGRFDGKYQGFIRLTDANGDGSVDDNPDTTANETKARDDWGLKTNDATGADKAGAAMLGVESGPVTIEYRDSDGKKQTLRIEIDNQPPAITIATPADGDSSGDQTPDFSGTIEDIDSGLADNSFRLVVDNSVDGDGKNDDYVLDGKAPNAGTVTGPDAGVSHIGEYTGFNTAPNTFGTVMASDLYDLMDDSCSNQNQCHITSEAYDDGANRGTFDDSVRLDLRDGTKDADTRDKEFEIDFQAFVMDMAGNIGFSDADPANPRFIKDLGEKKDDRDKNAAKYVLGYYSAHIVTLDEKDPEINAERSVTGFYGLNADDKMIADRSGVMVVFDGPIASSSVSTGTFSVELDDETEATVVDVDVDKKYVFLKLDSELASNATPKIDIVQGEKVEDMAGNETFGKEVDEFEAKDGISPKLTVTLSGGSGTGTGKEGPEQLTKEKITVHVSSDEALQGSPKITVVCSSLKWNQDEETEVTEDKVDSKHDIDDFVANRNGSFDGEPSDTPVMTIPRTANTKASKARGDTYDYTCGYDSPDNNFPDDFDLTTVSSLSRPGENWDYTWKNQSGGNRELNDGALTVVAFARDRSRYEGPSGKASQNWGSASAEFTLDTALKSPLESGGGQVQPDPDGTTKEARPFVLIEFAEATIVTLDSVELDDVEIAGEFEMPEDNRFVYWPLSLARGEHEVEVEASDAAGNDQVFDFKFKVEERGDFVINLLAGWNAISVPADPVDTAIGSVFTDSAIESVIGWDTGGWRIAVRRDGVWESNQKYGALNEIRSKYGYWVKSNNFVRQPVALTANDRGVGGPRTPIAIDTKAGWNFVGVIDQDGDQTEGDSGNTLKDSESTPISATEYLGTKYVRAYTWDATFSRFDVLRPDNTMTIGDGVWVYYEGGIAP